MGGSKTDIDVYLYGEGMKNFSSLWEYSTIPPIELPVIAGFEGECSQHQNLEDQNRPIC